MDIAGIDYSTHHVDIVRVGEGHAPEWTRVELRGADSFDRSRTVGEVFPGRSAIYWDDVLAVGIEEPAGRNTGHLFRIQGCILSRIPGRMLVQKWMPSQWRKAVGLKGNATKADVSWHVLEPLMGGWLREPYASWPQDACDAYCIALATQKALDREAA